MTKFDQTATLVTKDLLRAELSRLDSKSEVRFIKLDSRLSQLDSESAIRLIELEQRLVSRILELTNAAGRQIEHV